MPMPVVRFENTTYICEQNESTLDCLLRNGVNIPHTCKSGACQTCLMRAISGLPASSSQSGLKEAQRQQGYFLSCSCIPEGEMEVSMPDDVKQEQVSARVEQKSMFNPAVLRLILKPDFRFPYHAGQFINLYKSNNLSRCYSIASATDSNSIELNIAKIPNGEVSTWAFDELQVGDQISISSPLGDCFYTKGDLMQNILLLATGTGLAPIMGVLRDAFAANHIGDIYLYHGSKSSHGLYYIKDLRELEDKYENFHYFPCVSGETEPGFYQGRANERALEHHQDLKNWRIFLCGNIEMVAQTQRKCFLAGASLHEISADAFLY